MRKFDLLTPAAAMDKLNAALDAAHRTLPTETIDTVDALNRVLARDVIAQTPMPEFRRSTVDGYALRAATTPGVLRVAGEVRMGELAQTGLRPGEAVLVPTGGNLPAGADAVVMIEQTSPLDVNTTKIQTSTKLAPGDNVIQEGEDVKAGDAVLRAGARLHEHDMGGLLALGITRIEVTRQPRVALIASGDELVPATSPTQPGQIRNINAPMLAGLVQRHGGLPVDLGILPDVRIAFEEAGQRAMREADVIVFMAGSSVGERDFVPDVVNALGKPGILAHGILFRPGKPTLFAVCDGKPVFGLPGNPISALVTASLFVVPTLWRLLGAQNPPQPNVIRATLSSEVKSPKDLEHWFPVRLENGDSRLAHAQSPISNLQSQIANPVTTKSNLIFGLVRATGLACAPMGVDRLNAGDAIDVRLFD
jgi:molybdopterin molybdotransferase